MIIIKNASTVSGQKIDFTIESEQDDVINANGLTIFPGLIDPHVHFRTPGLEYKEDWRTASQAAIHGGYTTVFDMPNVIPPTITDKLLSEKKSIIDAQLEASGVPLRYELFFGADKSHFSEIPKIKMKCIGIKVFMGCSTGNLVIDDDESLDTVFKLASENNLILAVHAEDEARMCSRREEFFKPIYSVHSVIRDVTTATIAVEKAIRLARKHGTRLYLLHISTEEEINLVKDAKAEGLPIFAETTPHHLFLNTGFYEKLGGKMVINPPIREAQHQKALFKAINEGIIDTIGSDHAPHTLSEKSRPYGECPSGMPGIETTLPLLLTAYHQNLLSLKTIISLTHDRAQKIFNLPLNDDIVLVDLNLEKKVVASDLKTKCQWSAFQDETLKGWPVYTILRGQCFKVG